MAPDPTSPSPLTRGRVVAVVGPSGVGKDSVMTAMVERDPRVQLVRRVITRAPSLGGEDHDAITPREFQRRVRAGDFALHWQAHGLSYAIPKAELARGLPGQILLANLSRAALTQAAQVFDGLRVLHLTASPATLTTRLAARGREGASAIADRLAQADRPLPDGLDIMTLSNDGPLDQTVAAALAVLQPVRG